MMRSHAPHILRMIRWLRDHGATEVGVEQGGKRHPKIVFAWAGAIHRRAISCTPRDPDAAFGRQRQQFQSAFGIGLDDSGRLRRKL